MPKCPRCGEYLTNGGCLFCGYSEIVHSLDKAYGNVYEKIIGPEHSGSLSAATNAVSTLSSAFYTANINLGHLRAIGTSEKYLKPLEDDINRLHVDKIEAEKKVEALTKWPPTELDQFAEKITKKLDDLASAIRIDIQAVGLKVDGTVQMIQRLSQQVTKKEDVEDVERLVIQNQDVFIDRLIMGKEELIKTLNIRIGDKMKKDEKATLWQILDGLSVLGGAVQFADYVEKLVDFLTEKRILQIVLPIVVKFIFGG